MCLIAFAFSPGQERHLLLAANRDEFHQRPSRVMSWWEWPDGPLAGRDERAGGTWLALGRDGRWAAVTNFRDPQSSGGDRSRGDLPLAFIRSILSPQSWVERVFADRSGFGPFNLLAGDARTLWYCSTHAEPREVAPGVHALSNGLLDEPWPKSRRVMTALKGLAKSDAAPDSDRLFDLMDDREPAPDAELPDTGIGRERERMLSPPFIVSEQYGTRCSTVVVAGERTRVAERSFDPAGTAMAQVDYEFARLR